MAFTIREACSEDAPFVLALFARPHVRKFTHGPTSIDAFLDALRRDDRTLLTVERDGHAFGHVGFALIDAWLIEIRVIAFAEQRTGAGRFAMEWLLHHAFFELRVHRIFLEVLESNAGARALYERLGFRQEGCYRDGFRADDGTYHNLIPYGILDRMA